MRDLCDYMIVQRDDAGFGKAVFSGSFTRKTDSDVVVARVVREDDNMTVIPWTECEPEGENWRIELSIPEGGLYRLEARQREERAAFSNNAYDWGDLLCVVRHVGVGDLFLMAGQSNMSGYGKDFAYDPPELGIHLFDNAGRWDIAAHPLNSVPDPVYCNNDPNSGTSPALAFARKMKRELGVPIGLIAAARGGSALEAWNPAEEDPFLFRAMEEKIKETGAFKGMIWYQGCNETCENEEADSYLEKFTQAVALWREQYGFFPIATCQINRHAWKDGDRDRSWGKVREAQRQAARTIPGVYVVPTIDMPMSDGIHNGSGANVIIGERLAAVMLKGHYGKPGFFAPDIRRIRKLDSRHILLVFDEGHMMRSMDDLASGLNIEDENGIMKCTAIGVTDDGAVVTAERDIGENAVFHAYWERELTSFFIRDIYGMPMLACFGVKIED